MTLRLCTLCAGLLAALLGMGGATARPGGDPPGPRRFDDRPRLARPAAPRAGPLRWRVHESRSFRVLYLDGELAPRLAAAAEAARVRLYRDWTGRAPALAWSPRCDLYLYRSTEELVQMTGGDPKAGSAQARPARLSPGQMLERRINVAADDDGLFETTIPHEVTHVLSAELLAGQPLPRWADEGMAMLAESERDQRRREETLRARLRRAAPFRLRDLVRMGYPDEEYMSLFYAQSVSVVRYLVRLGGRPTLLAFLRTAGRYGVDYGLRYHYGLGGLTDLESRWRAAQREEGR
ncbi:MAG: hypothetical protein IT371_16510 [Deltaproteobacteria bacterium]|nr:hypothetical protein [Deltaproteobacteria bacterium]